ncbi:folate-binding protein YgfZ [Mesorhizobium sp. B2-7-2]|uniref:CAF17-like 4Fe-4S cluster assembly/insertion protein YgfZ n=1 Tax=Mesorhizobium sp. B2-7-2 TaxID=2589908 RepID=UPI00112D265E|nr:folate-binding protein YgfZ [Mesorhizobium sp. B2-7-2]TPJ24509.1 folate-binding protein YgfZ [Mesorhizobium sp. B2-7-2]
MPFAQIKDRALISVSGPDAEHFLQNILTTDLDTLAPGEAKPGALLSPQGKILFDFLVSRAGDDGFQLECRADIADDFVRRLMLYRLRAKAEIAKQDQVLVTVAWGDDSTASRSDSSVLADTRFQDITVTRTYGGEARDGGDPNGWLNMRIGYGIAESGSDYQLGDAFPHDVLFDETGGVGFKKGCYVGQEVVSRMQHRGTARRRVLIAVAAGPLPPAGAEVTVNGRPVGILGSSNEGRGLAIVRTDRVKAAIDAHDSIRAGETPIMLAIPHWAKFTFPQDAASAEEA